MKSSSLPRIALAVLVVAAGTAAQAQESLRPQGPVAFINGMLLDGYEAEPIHDAVVVIDDGRIVAAGTRRETPLPDGTAEIDIGGRTLMPGLIDAHVHVDLIGHGDYDRYYRFLNGMQRLPEVMPIAAKQMLRAGVTSAIDLGAPFQILELRERIDRGEIPGPRLTISGPWLTRDRLAGIPDEYQVILGNPRDTGKRTRELIEAGSDVIKAWAGLNRIDYDEIVKEARRHGVNVHAHLYHPDKIRMALDAGVDVLHHVGSGGNVPYDDELVLRIAHDGVPIVQTIAHRIWVYPATVEFPARLRDPVHRKDVPPDIHAEVMDSFRNFHRLPYFHDIGAETRNSTIAARQFIDAGAVMGVGSDAASPLNFHTEAMYYEMKALVESGMTPIQVISAATRVNAGILGKSDELGTVEPGKLADLIVVDGNPLADIDAMNDVEIVVRDGVVWYAESAAHGAVTEFGRAF